MAWICKECGNEIMISESYLINKDYKVNKAGEPKGKCLKKCSEYQGAFFFCPHCNSESEILKDIAEYTKK